MTSSEPYVAIPDCQSVRATQRALVVECPHFPDENPHGLKDQLYVHYALMHAQAPMPPQKAYGDDTGYLIVLKRFVDVNKVDNYTIVEDINEYIPNQEEHAE